LHTLRVRELGTVIAGLFCARILAARTRAEAAPA